MTTLQADTFAAFVDSLASHLDDHDARGEDLAARVHLSRFHFDRVVSATAGETPSKFRRRILLERSAYRLATTAMGVLDVAVEAGFSSNEAFTRAFQRAYGVAPSAWRSRPRQPHLDSPNGVHFHPPGGLRLPPRKKVTSMDLVLRMIEHHVWLIEEMIDRAATLQTTRSMLPSTSPLRASTTGRRCARCCHVWSVRWTCGTALSRCATMAGTSRTMRRSTACAHASARWGPYSSARFAR